MSACELLTHCHPLRAWRASQIAVLERAFDYWRAIDRDLGDRIAAGVRG